MTKPFRTFLKVAVIGMATSVSAHAAQLQGQLVLQSEATSTPLTGVFSVPGDYARLRIVPAVVSEARIEVNDRVVFDGTLDPAENAQYILTSKDAVKTGKNALSLKVKTGDVAVSVDYPELEFASPEEGLTATQSKALQQTLQPFIGTDPDKHLFPGVALLVARQGKVLYSAGQGMAQYQLMNSGRLHSLASPRKVAADTVFDLASVTKVVSTTAAVMHLVSEHRLSLDDTLGDLLPGFSQTDKAGITVQQLLTHRSGLWEWQPLWLHKRQSRDSVFAWLASLPRRYGITEKRAYSDIGFMLLGKIVEQISKMPLNDYVYTFVHQPLGMNRTRYLPPESWLDNIAATSQGNPYEQHMVNSSTPYPVVENPPFERNFDGYRDYTLTGEANDGNAWYALEGVAGHAGLFSALPDLAIYCQTLLNGGGYGNAMLTGPETLAAFLNTPYDTGQALGFWRYEDGEGRESFGHAGFTGTQLMFRPDDGLIVIMLTNRQHNGLRQDGTYPSVQPAWQAILSVVDSFW